MTNKYHKSQSHAPKFFFNYYGLQFFILNDDSLLKIESSSEEDDCITFDN